MKKDLRKIAEEVDEREIYSLVYGPTSSMVHGMYDTLDRYYLRQCVNPFHKLHRVPFYWTKSPLSAFGPVNVMTIMDWVFGEILDDIGLSKPTSMPGEKYIARFFDEEQYKQFCERDDIRMEAAENQDYVDKLNERFQAGGRSKD